MPRLDTCSECGAEFENYGPPEPHPTCNQCQTAQLYEFLDEHPEYDPESPSYNPNLLGSI